jgi:hypothetical protein
LHAGARANAGDGNGSGLDAPSPKPEDEPIRSYCLTPSIPLRFGFVAIVVKGGERSKLTVTSLYVPKIARPVQPSILAMVDRRNLIINIICI